MQPDFSALFRKTEIAPLSFTVRPGPNAAHDIHFLSGYLHDARFSPSAVDLDGETLTVFHHRKTGINRGSRG